MPDQPAPGKNTSNLSAYLRYSGMAMEFFILCAVGAFIGSKLDKWAGLAFPVFTIILLLAAMAGAFFRIFRQVNKR